MKRTCYLLLLIFISTVAVAQNDAYTKTVKAWQQSYISTHEIVKGKDRKYFRFFPINGSYYITADFEKITDTVGFKMRTSDGTQQFFYTYGVLKFSLFSKPFKLYVYQSRDLMSTEKYKDFLFLPFTDKSNGSGSYGSGRYLQFYSSDIKDNQLIFDFNGAYNPYCAYGKGYHCPLPPKENNLPVAIRAGEMIFGKK